ARKTPLALRSLCRAPLLDDQRRRPARDRRFEVSERQRRGDRACLQGDRPDRVEQPPAGRRTPGRQDGEADPPEPPGWPPKTRGRRPDPGEEVEARPRAPGGSKLTARPDPAKSLPTLGFRWSAGGLGGDRSPTRPLGDHQFPRPYAHLLAFG